MRRVGLVCIAGATAIAIACGSSDEDSGSTPPGDGGAPDSSTPDGTGLPPADSGSDAIASVDNPCGPDRRCKYQGEVVGSLSASPPVALAIGAATSVAYGDFFGESVAVRVAQGTWATSAAPTGMGGSPFVRMATDASGMQWIAFKDAGGQLAVAHGMAGTTADTDAGMWTVETAVSQTTFGAGLAIGSDGVPVAVSAGTTGIILARRSGNGTWAPATVDTIIGGTRNVALAMNGPDPFVVWPNPKTGKLMFAHAMGATTFASEEIASVGTFYHDDTVAVAVDAAGHPHIAYKPDNDILYTTRVGGAWTTAEEVPLVSFPMIIAQFGAVRIAVAPSGVVAVGVAGAVITVSTKGVGGAWFTQPVTNRCQSDRPGFDMVYGPSETLMLAHSCGDDITLMTQAGNYPPGYDASCLQGGTTACDTACASCPHYSVMSNDLCCIKKGSQDDCTSPSNITDCAKHYAVALCGDATQDPTVPATCTTALASPTCDPPDASTPGLQLPATCPAPPP